VRRRTPALASWLQVSAQWECQEVVVFANEAGGSNSYRGACYRGAPVLHPVRYC
jgi:hypothetical protein